MTRQQARFWSAIAAAAILFGGAVVVFLTAADYGVAWDDYVQTRYGDLVLDYFVSGGQNKACNDLLDLKYYAPAFELIAAAISRFAPERNIEIRHVLTALTALLIVPPLVGFGRLLGNPWSGVAAAVILLLTPAWYGHAFINSKDIPFAVGYAWSMFALAAMFARGQFRWPEVLGCGLAIGLTVSVRPGGWMLVGVTYAAIATWYDWRLRVRSATAPRRRTLLKMACLLLVAWAIMVVPWPWAHENPWTHPLMAIRMASQFHVVVPVLFEGQVYPSNELPRYYLLKYLLITMPPIVLVLAGLGFAVMLIERCRRLNHPRTTVLILILTWMFLPLAIFFVLRPNAYDGLRHFLFMLPALALWAAIGGQWAWNRMSHPGMRTAFALTLAAAAGLQVHSLARLHPYQMTYFNFAVGGVQGASDRYETESWLTSYKEAMEWIERQPQPHPGEPIDVLVAANENSRWCAAYYAGDRLRVTTTLEFGQTGDLPPGIEYYVGTSRSSMNGNFPEAPVVWQVAREGAVFTTIRRTARAPSASPSPATPLTAPIAAIRASDTDKQP